MTASHNYLNKTHVCVIKESFDLNKTAPVPGRPHGLLET